MNNHLRLDRSTLTKKCGIFRQGVCDFDVLCIFKVHFGNKTAVFSSKSQSGLAMITNPDLYQYSYTMVNLIASRWELFYSTIYNNEPILIANQSRMPKFQYKYRIIRKSCGAHIFTNIVSCCIISRGNLAFFRDIHNPLIFVGIFNYFLPVNFV